MHIVVGKYIREFFCDENWICSPEASSVLYILFNKGMVDTETAVSLLKMPVNFIMHHYQFDLSIVNISHYYHCVIFSGFHLFFNFGTSCL